MSMRNLLSAFTQNKNEDGKFQSQPLLPKCDFQGKPTNLTDDWIRYLGDIYLFKYGETSTLKHNRQASAEKLSGYTSSSENSDDKWNFLISIYNDLPTNEGKLAESIRHTISAGFDTSIRIHRIVNREAYPLSVTEVSNQLRQIVDEYYLKYYKKIAEEQSKEISMLKKEIDTLKQQLPESAYNVTKKTPT